VVANVLSTCPIRGAMTLFGNSLATTVNVGSGGSVQNIRGTVRIENEPSFTTLNVDDQSDPRTPTLLLHTFTPPRPTQVSRIRVLPPAEIDFHCADSPVFPYPTLFRSVVANVLSTCPIRGAITLFGNSSATTVNVGNNGSVQNIRGTLTIQSSQGLTALTVDN